MCYGSPKWSADSKQVVFHELPVESTWDARVFQLSARATSQIVSVDLETGKRTEHTSGPGLKLEPQFMPDGRVGYATKNGKQQGIAYTSGTGKLSGAMRSPSWSSDGKQVIYEKVDYRRAPRTSCCIAGIRITNIATPTYFQACRKMEPCSSRARMPTHPW